MLYRSYFVAAAALCWAPLALAQPATPTPVPAPFVLELVADSLGPITDITGDPTRTEQLFLTTKAGRVLRIDSTTGTSEEVLNISSQVDSAGNEMGLLGLAFDPDFASNNFFYVFYTGPNNPTRTNQLSRFTYNPDTGLADPNSEMVVIAFQNFSIGHNGASVVISPIDGYLYLSIGDNSPPFDPFNLAQTTTTLDGTIIRIEPVDTATEGEGSAEGEGGTEGEGAPSALAPARSKQAGAPTGNYQVPADNPFVGNPDFLPEIWAYGLRNPFRASVDRMTGDIWMGDVGQNEREEINYQPAGVGGQNYGWRIFEASRCVTESVTQQDCDDAAPGLTFPILEYEHGDLGSSVTGGFVYRGTAIPELFGLYIHSDFLSGRIRAIERDGNTAAAWLEYEGIGQPNDFVFGLSTFGEDNAGELYAASLSDGLLFKLVPAPPAEGEGEGNDEGEGTTEGEGVVVGEGTLEGEGTTEGEGIAEGEGGAEGEGLAEGEGIAEGEGEGMAPDLARALLEQFSALDTNGDGALSFAEAENAIGGADPQAAYTALDTTSDDALRVAELRSAIGSAASVHAADQTGDNQVSLSELLRVIQFFNSGGYGCAANPGATEDGYVAGSGPQDCLAHDSDYNPTDFSISLSELLRLIQFFNTGGYSYCPELTTEDGYCPGAA